MNIRMELAKDEMAKSENGSSWKAVTSTVFFFGPEMVGFLRLEQTVEDGWFMNQSKAISWDCTEIRSRHRDLIETNFFACSILAYPRAISSQKRADASRAGCKESQSSCVRTFDMFVQILNKVCIKNLRGRVTCFRTRRSTNERVAWHSSAIA